MKVKLPKILCSSVVRSTHRGDSHGGIYIVDLNSGDYEKVIDWNNPNINWEGRGGDRGIRGLSVYNGLLYAVAGNELFAFDMTTWKIADSWTTKYMFLTHECWQHKDKLYICAGGSDSILVFDLKRQKWTFSYYHNKECSDFAKMYDPISGNGYQIIYGGKHHLDSVIVDDSYIYFCGAYTPQLLAIHKETLQIKQYPKFNISETHNARLYRDGVLYNVSRMSKTVYQDFNGPMVVWDTPHYKQEDMTHTNLPADHAVQGYTRGMVTYKNFIICGSSPATINVFDFDQPGDTVKSVQLTSDLRNSICGITFLETNL